MSIGIAGSAIIVADAATVIGVIDDPLLFVTGGVVVGGGVAIMAEGVVIAFGGIIDWLTSW